MIYSISNLPYSVNLGRQGDSGFIELLFDVTEWKNRFGSGTATIVYQNPNGETRTAATGNISDKILTWNVSALDTAVVGKGKAEIRLTADGVSGKTATFKTVVLEGMTGEPESTNSLEQSAESGRFIGSFDSEQQLNSYSGECRNNDYAYINTVSQITSQIIKTDKYIYSNGQWLFAYSIFGGDRA